MKKTQTLFKMLATAIMVIAIFASQAIAQPGGGALWQPLGSDTVQTSRNVKINRALRVLEKIIAESIDTKSIFAKSIEVKDYLKVGDHAMWLVPNPPFSDDIRSDIGVIALMEGNDTSFSSNIKVGIGTQTPQSILHLHQVANTPLFAQWTNGFTGATATDGFQAGIAANGTAELRQRENAPIDIFTNNFLRIGISADGKVKIIDLANTDHAVITADANGTLSACNLSELSYIITLETRLTQLENKLETLLAQKN